MEVQGLSGLEFALSTTGFGVCASFIWALGIWIAFCTLGFLLWVYGFKRVLFSVVSESKFWGLRYFIGGQVFEANGLWVQSLGLWHSSREQGKP